MSLSRHSVIFQSLFEYLFPTFLGLDSYWCILGGDDDDDDDDDEFTPGGAMPIGD